jgi:myb proto-oncogene protein
LKPSIGRANAREGEWSEDEDSKLMDAVQTQGGNYWGAIAALVPGRTKRQCKNRWSDVLDPFIDRANGRKGRWTSDEDSKLKDAVQTHGGKEWAAISALVPGRTKRQCNSRWCDVSHPSIALTAGRTGEWSEDEDIKLQDAVQTQGDKDWAAISSLVPGRTKMQCSGRWNDFLDPFIDQANGRKGKWTLVKSAS